MVGAHIVIATADVTLRFRISMLLKDTGATVRYIPALMDAVNDALEKRKSELPVSLIIADASEMKSEAYAHEAFARLTTLLLFVGEPDGKTSLVREGSRQIACVSYTLLANVLLPFIEKSIERGSFTSTLCDAARFCYEHF